MARASSTSNEAVTFRSSRARSRFAAIFGFGLLAASHLAHAQSSVTPAVTASPAPDATATLVRVRLATNDPLLRIEHLPANGGMWTLACTAPCEATLPRNDSVRVAGRGRRPTPSVAVGEDGALEPRMGLRGGDNATAAFFLSGGVLAVGGLIGLLVGVFVSQLSPRDLPAVMIPSAAAVALGGVHIGLGFYFDAASRSSVRFQPGSRVAWSIAPSGVVIRF